MVTEHCHAAGRHHGGTKTDSRIEHKTNLKGSADLAAEEENNADDAGKEAETVEDPDAVVDSDEKVG
jgi:hypothetical protein